MKTASSARVFLALEIPAAVKAQLAEKTEGLRRELPKARWTRSEGQHLTLKFFGDVEPSVIESLITGLAPRLGSLETVDVNLTGAGFFPSSKRPRVAWVGGSTEGAEMLVAAIENLAETLSFPRERRDWSPHVTLARLKAPWPRSVVARFLDWGEKLCLDSFSCTEVVLFSSELRPGGAVYTPVERMPLG